MIILVNFSINVEIGVSHWLYFYRSCLFCLNRSHVHVFCILHFCKEFKRSSFSFVLNFHDVHFSVVDSNKRSELFVCHRATYFVSHDAKHKHWLWLVLFPVLLVPELHILALIVHWNSFLLWHSFLVEWYDTHFNVLYLNRVIFIFFDNLRSILESYLCLIACICCCLNFRRKICIFFIFHFFVFFLFLVIWLILNMNICMKLLHFWRLNELFESYKRVSFLSQYPPFFRFFYNVSSNSPCDNWT